MNDFWKNALKVSPIVTIVAFVLWWVVGKVFEEKVLTLFGEGQLFTIIILVISGLLICLFTAILTFKQKNLNIPSESNNKTTFKDTTIQGDVVLGNKNMNINNEEQ